MNFTDYQNQISSEKLVLATVEASKRLMGWVVHSGSVYKLTGVALLNLISIEDSGSLYASVGSIGAITTSKYYFDKAAQTIYLKTVASDNPNSRFLAGNFKLFFANLPVTLPYDLGSGYEVYWEPLVRSTSAFGVEIDTLNQTSEAIEGSGTLTLINDQDFWPSYYDQLTFENKPCLIYSYNRKIKDPTQAKLLFQGQVQKKTFDDKILKFTLQDLIGQLRTTLPLSDISELGQRNDPGTDKAKQRMILGSVFGHRPMNLDQVNDGYPLSGTVTVTHGDPNIIGSGTSFLAKVSPDDTLVIDGEQYTVAEVTSDTDILLSEDYGGNNMVGLSITITPALPKRYTNRIWNVAGHALKQPTTTTGTNSSITKIYVASTENMFAGDDIYIGPLGSGELATISEIVNSSLLRVTQSLTAAPGPGVTITRPAIQNVRLNDIKLRYYTDYTFNATTSELVLRETAEVENSPIRQLTTTLTFASGSRVVSGTGLEKIIQPGYSVGIVGNTDFFEVLSVNETGLVLRTPANFNGTDTGQYKPFIFNADNDVLTCDCFGRTEDGTSSGVMLKNASQMVKTLLTDLGLSSILDTDSFDESAIDAPHLLGLVIPDNFDDKDTPIYRAIINDINKSVNGAIVQTNAFNLKHFIIQPFKDNTALRFFESDIMDFKTTASAENVVKTAIVQYQRREYDYLSKNESVRTSQQTSDISTYLLKIDRTKTLVTKLVNQADAANYANRWSFLLENATYTISFKTKLQATLLEVGDIIDFAHRKLFVRKGGTDRRRILLIEKIQKNGLDVAIEAVDLSNAFNRIAAFTEGTDTYDTASEDDRLYGGYFTDLYGIINDEPDSFGSNLFF